MTFVSQHLAVNAIGARLAVPWGARDEFHHELIALDGALMERELQRFLQMVDHLVIAGTASFAPVE